MVEPDPSPDAKPSVDWNDPIAVLTKRVDAWVERELARRERLAKRFPGFFGELKRATGPGDAISNRWACPHCSWCCDWMPERAVDALRDIGKHLRLHAELNQKPPAPVEANPMVEPEFSPHEERLCCVLKDLVEPAVLRMVLRELKRIEAESLAADAPPAPAEAPDSPYSFGEPWRYLTYHLRELPSKRSGFSAFGGSFGIHTSSGTILVVPPDGTSDDAMQSLGARILAAMNFCSGVSTADLERSGLDGLLKLLAQGKGE